MSPDDLASLLNIPRLPFYLGRLENELIRIVKSNGAALGKPAGRLASSGGKRLRPILVMSSALIVKGRLDDQTMSAARVVELVHLASLVHDDQIDETSRRRGRAAVHRQDGKPTALLLGDYLLALACTQAAQSGRELAEQVAKTVVAMADGQAGQFSKDYKADPSNKLYLDVITKKTGTLFATACWSGGLNAGAAPTQLKALYEYGLAFGMAFQIIDDLIDKEIPEGLGAKAATKAKEYNAQALNALGAFSDNSIKDGLGRLPGYYLNWALPAKVL